MQVTPLAIPVVKLVEPPRVHDDRGFFSEVFSVRTFSAHGLATSFVQDNHSFSARAGTVRGLHFQRPPFAQAKLVRVVRGCIFDVAVDLRQGSATYGRWVAAELSADNWRQLFIPEGFAHGFCTIEDSTEVVYKVSAFHAPDHDAGIRWNDPDLGVDWPVDAAAAILSDKDARQPWFRDLASPFVCEGAGALGTTT